MKKGVKIGLIVLLLAIAVFAIYYLTKSVKAATQNAAQDGMPQNLGKL